MLIMFGKRIRLCDRVPRRHFLTIGGLGLRGLAVGGLSLPQLLRAEDRVGIRGSHKSVIMIYLTGGPPHLDMVDPKPDAPAEIRGDFQPISTNVPGIQVSELMPRTAAMMDKFAIIRSLVGAEDQHASFQCVTGHVSRQQPVGGWPEIGSILSRLHGPMDPAVPPAVDLSMKMEHLPYNLPGAGFLGTAHTPFKPSGDALNDMVLDGIEPDRLADRGALLASLDRLRRRVDQQAVATPPRGDRSARTATGRERSHRAGVRPHNGASTSLERRSRRRARRPHARGCTRGLQRPRRALHGLRVSG